MKISNIFQSFLRWFDTEEAPDLDHKADRIDWLRVLPFIGMHLACLGIFFVSFSWFAVSVAVFLYLLRMFAITGFYHRYFSHRAFKTSRTVQFVFALIGASSVQRGPIWWAAHHRNHHRHSDQVEDLHSPVTQGFWMSHVGWFLTKRGFKTDKSRVTDWIKFAELRWLDRYDVLVPILLAVGLMWLGHILQIHMPSLKTSGPQLLFWGFFFSTVVLFHATFTINSLAHQFGKRRYNTRDDSRNNWWLAIITLGEGWHNNHHHFPASARQGFFWWEYDFTFYALKCMSWFGLVYDLKTVPIEKRAAVA